MRPTSVLTLTAAVIAGGTVLWGIQRLVIAAGQPAIVPPLTWALVLAALGAIILALAWPIRRRVVESTSAAPIDPFYATRVVLLAKSSAIAGGLFAGGSVGLGIVLLGRPLVSSETLWLTVAGVVGAILLVVGGLFAERWCTLPPDAPEANGLVASEGDPA